MKTLSKRIEPWLWLFPSLAFVIIFSYIPLFKTFLISFFIVSRTGAPVSFVGLQNYRVILSDPIFHAAVANTLKFALVTVPVTIIGGFLLSVLFAKQRPLSVIFEGMLTIPCAVSLSVAAMIFQTLFMPNIGLINKLTGLSIKWLYDSRYALAVLCLIQIWSSLSFAFIYYTDSIRNISPEIIDSAFVEGANNIQLIWHILVPLTAPTSFFLLFANITSSIMMMSLANVLTGGGPRNSTTTLVQYVYNKFISTGNLTVTNAATVLFFLITLLFVFILFTWWDEREKANE